MTRRLGVAQWFSLVLGALLVVAASVMFAGLLALGRLSERRELLTDRIDPANLMALRLSGALLDEETGVRGYALAGDATFLGPYRDGRAAETAALRELARLQATVALARPLADLRRVRRLTDAWRADYAEPLIRAVRNGREPPPAALGRERFDALRVALGQEQRDLQAARDRARTELGSTVRLVTAMFAGVGLAVLLVVAAAALILRHVIITPMSRLATEVREVASGDFNRPVVPSGPREIAALGADVEAMRERIVAELAALRDAERTLIAQSRDLQRSNEELEQFAYVASHDLQEPLRKVASFTQMLERRYKGRLDERADGYIAFAVDGAKRMQELIDDLLDFSRVGRMTPPPERVETADLVEQACVRLSALLRETGARVDADGLPAVIGDPGLLTAVFQNLISNAVKFRGDRPPHVRFAAEREGRCWRFTCTDSGIGIEDEYAERIFVIFQRLHTREAYAGTGIGLALCRKIVEHHGGLIWLAPAEPGRGARFAFTLPADDSEEEPAP